MARELWWQQDRLDDAEYARLVEEICMRKVSIESWSMLSLIPFSILVFARMFLKQGVSPAELFIYLLLLFGYIPFQLTDPGSRVFSWRWLRVRENRLRQENADRLYDENVLQRRIATLDRARKIALIREFETKLLRFLIDRQAKLEAEFDRRGDAPLTLYRLGSVKFSCRREDLANHQILIGDRIVNLGQMTDEVCLKVYAAFGNPFALQAVTQQTFVDTVWKPRQATSAALSLSGKSAADDRSLTRLTGEPIDSAASTTVNAT